MISEEDRMKNKASWVSELNKLNWTNKRIAKQTGLSVIEVSRILMDKIANISHDSFSTYTGTAIPTDYKFVCWVGDVNEEKLLEEVADAGRDIIQVIIPVV